MGHFIISRFLQMFFLIIIVSIVVFIIIQLPPGDYINTYIAELESLGTDVSDSIIRSLRTRYGLDEPGYVRYFMWVRNIVFHGDFGDSFQYDRPVAELIGERLLLTFIISFLSLLFIYVVAVPIGIYSAIRQYSLFDYFFTFIAFIGVAIPNFLFALIILYVVFDATGIAFTGLLSMEFQTAPWSIPKVLNMLSRIWVPVVVVGTAGTAGLMRVTRGMILDELSQLYVTTARSKGVAERKILFKYVVRIAINPLISTIGWRLPQLISGGTLVAIVLNLPTTGPMLLQSLLTQDMYLAGSFLLILSFLVIIGTFISDLLLIVIDPRIKFGEVTE